MLIGLTIVGFLVAIWLAAALIPVVRHGISFQQGLLYAPLKLVYSIDDRQIALARQCKTPVIYAVLNRSKLDPALMLALLPDTTLHILDDRSAAAAWLEPFRAIAPTIAFNAEHVFVSRRLVRRLKGGGRLAVYMPDDVELDPKGFRLYRAIARIASQANARIVPIDIVGARHLPFSHTPPEKAIRHRFPCLTIRCLEGRTIDDLTGLAGENRTTRAHSLFDRISELRIDAANPERSLFRALREAARLHGPRRIVVEDPLIGAMSYRRLFAQARIIGRHVQGKTEGAQEPVGLLLPNSGLMTAAFLGIQSAGRPAALIDPARTPEAISAFLRTAGVRIVLSSHAIVQEAGLGDLIDGLKTSGVRMVWLEDIRNGTGRAGRLAARLAWRFALIRRNPEDPAVMLSGRTEDGQAEALVLSQRNILVNILQIQTRVEITPADTVVNLLQAHNCAGLAGGTLLALMSGARLRFAARDPQTDFPGADSGRIRPTILLATETILARLTQTGAIDLSRLRAVLAGAEPVTPHTREAFRNKYGVEIMEGYGVGEAAPVVAVNSPTHSREGTIGRLLPGIRMRLEPVEGMEGGAGRLWLSGPSLVRWVIEEERPGQLRPAGEWLDTGDIVAVDREGFLTLLQRPEPELKANAAFA